LSRQYTIERVNSTPEFKRTVDDLKPKICVGPCDHLIYVIIFGYRYVIGIDTLKCELTELMSYIINDNPPSQPLPPSPAIVATTDTSNTDNKRSTIVDQKQTIVPMYLAGESCQRRWKWPFEYGISVDSHAFGMVDDKQVLVLSSQGRFQVLSSCDLRSRSFPKVLFWLH
jgi:hypothetical protein